MLLAAGSCYPVDTGTRAANLALMQMDELAYSMQNETAVLQSQIDSLVNQLRKTDSLVRWLANLTGNPVQDPVQLYIPPP